MAARPCLFTRTREFKKTFERLSSRNFIIVLLDIYSDNTCLRQELGHLSNCHYLRADGINNCLGLINQDDAKDALIMLIISNQFIDFVRNTLLEIAPQLSHIYLFDNVLYEKQPLSDRRFRGAFDDIQPLLEKIRCDIEEVRSPKHVTEGIQYILEDNSKFFWYRFFFNVLDRLQHTDIAKRELISRLRNLCKENSRICHMIDKFEHEYSPGTVIRWYTEESFFYRSLNKALRTNDINEIFLWRAYIQDLDRSIRQLCLQQVNSKQKLYRGQQLHIDDVNRCRENTGKLITMNSFLSTSAVAEIAEMFAGNNTLADPPLQSVLCSITTDTNALSTICADIRERSWVLEEEEHLFSLRSMFRIEHVQLVDDRWLMDLKAIDEDDQEFCAAINPWKTTIGEQSFFSGRHQPLFTRYLNFENGPFLAFQLLIDLMLRLDQTDFARQEMIEMCRRKYADRPTDLKKISEFEQTYQHDDAIKWYTVDSFLYRRLHESLRSEDIDTIFKLRYYIYDLHNQLALLQTPYIHSLPDDEPILTLYRGQRMPIKELEKLQENVDKLISMNSFLSTTDSIAAAILFSGDGSLDDPTTEVSVIYQITIDTRVSHSIPFAKIDYLSVYEDEDEVLFSMASVFRIDVVEQYGKLWIVDLTLIEKEDEKWNILTSHLNN